MALENGHCFTRVTNQNRTAILVDAEDAVRVLFEMKAELKTIIEKLKPQITQDKKYTKEYRKALSDKVAYNEGFAEALEVVAYMCGWDFYYHTPEGDGTKETLRDKEAFAELLECHEIESAPAYLYDRLAEFE